MPFGLIQVLLAFGMVVIVPLGLDVLAATTPPPESALLSRARRSARLPAAVAALSLLFTPGTSGAVGFALPWLVLCLGVTYAGIRSWLRAPSLGAAEVSRLAATSYLSVGAVWLLIDRLGRTPLDIAVAIVLLTAVHFHFAGFAAATIASRTAGAATTTRRIAEVSAWLTVSAPPIIALGFAAWWPAQVAGAIVLTVGLLGVAHVLFWDVRRTSPERRAMALTTVAALAVVVPMGLAVQWSLGSNLGWPHLSIPAMARTHGVLNAFGFSLCGLLAYRRRDLNAT